MSRHSLYRDFFHFLIGEKAAADKVDRRRTHAYHTLQAFVLSPLLD